MIQCTNLQWMWDDASTPLFDNVTGTIQRGDRVGIIGRNGAGKSTLLQLLIGERQPTSGTIQTDASFAYVAGHATDHEPTFSKREVALLEAWHVPDAPYDTLSGGEQLKARLATACSVQRDVYVLDEPTNHIDRATKAWLTSFIRASEATWLIVSHDRTFLNDVTTVTWGLVDGTGFIVNGPYDVWEEAFSRKRADDFAQYEANEALRAETERQMKALSDWSANMHAQSTSNVYEKQMGAKEHYRVKAKRADRQVKSKRKRLERTLDRERIERPARLHDVSFSLPATPKSKRPFSEWRDVTVQYGNRTVLDGVSMTWPRRKKIALIGNNGAGKTTVLDVLSGTLPPTEGSATTAPNVSIGYVSQHPTFPDETCTVLESVETEDRSQNEIVHQQLFHLGLFPDRWNVPLHDCSYGERTKISFLRYVLEAVDVLLFDEPTNHLDLPSREALARALLSYDGTVIFATHDESFVRDVATDVYRIEQGSIRLTDDPFGDE